MTRSALSIAAAALAASMALPAVVEAAESYPTTTTARVRVYDPYYHDYHNWNSREEHAYREYLAARHRAYIAYRRQALAQRRAYWHWRHEREERLEHERR